MVRIARFEVTTKTVRQGSGCRWFSLSVEDTRASAGNASGRFNVERSFFYAEAVKLDDGRVSVFETTHARTGYAVRRDSRVRRDIESAVKRALEAA